MTRRAGPELHRRVNLAEALADGEIALKLYFAGTPWRVVAEHLGTSPSTARRRGLFFKNYRPPIPEPRHLVPAQRCLRRRSNGQPCRSWAIRGGWVCWTHGGAAPQVQAAAARRIAELEADHDHDEPELRPGVPSSRVFHHDALTFGARQGRLFVGGDRRRWERTQRRKRNQTQPPEAS